MHEFKVTGYIDISQLRSSEKEAKKVPTDLLTDLIRTDRGNLPLPDEILFPELIILGEPRVLDVVIYINASDNSYAHIYSYGELSNQLSALSFKLPSISFRSSIAKLSIAVIEPGVEMSENPSPRIQYILTGYTTSKLSTSNLIM